MSKEAEHNTPDLAHIASILICPKCSAEVSIQADQVLCSGCGTKYPIRDGVPLLARMGTTNTWDGSCVWATV